MYILFGSRQVTFVAKADVCSADSVTAGVCHCIQSAACQFANALHRGGALCVTAPCLWAAGPTCSLSGNASRSVSVTSLSGEEALSLVTAAC